MKMLAQQEIETRTMSTAALNVIAANDVIEISSITDREQAARALALVRQGVITGEGPTTAGRIHFSRALDRQDAEWCARILRAQPLTRQPVSRAEAEALFGICGAATERSDAGLFDDLFAKAVVHHAAAASGLPVPSRDIALAPDVAIDSWAPTKAVGVNVEVLEWVSAQMRGTRRSNPTLIMMVATLIGAATLPLTQLPGVFDLGM